MNDDIEPPLGLMPRYLWEEERLSIIDAAIIRYNEVDKTIPEEWIEERAEIYQRLQERREKLAPKFLKSPLFARLGKVLVPKWLIEDQLDQIYFKAFF